MRSSVYFVMAKIPVFTMAHVSELICHCWTAFFSFVQSIRTAWCHDTNSHSSVHFCDSTGLLFPSVMWPKSYKKKGHSRKLSIYINLYKLYKHTTKRRRKKKKRSITMTLTLWLGRWFFFFFLNLPRPSDFPGMNKVYCYCCFDTVSSRTDAF